MAGLLIQHHVEAKVCTSCI